MTRINYEDTTIRHGEMMMVQIDENLLDGLETVEQGKQIILAHSETGHHHVAVGDGIKYAPITNADPRFKDIVKALGYDTSDVLPTAFQPFRAKTDSELRHLKEFDKHETKPIHAGLYVVPIKTEYDPFTRLIQKVRD